MSIEHPQWCVASKFYAKQRTTRITILDVAKFIDLCKKNHLDYKKIIIESAKN